MGQLKYSAQLVLGRDSKKDERGSFYSENFFYAKKVTIVFWNSE
jgi:hypothetical protein